MTTEAQRIAIAEACGWQREKTPFTRHSARIEGESGTVCDNAWWHPTIAGCTFSPPDYLNDLNAMHEAEKVLTSEQNNEYIATLQTVCGSSVPLAIAGSYVHATAAQRAEAFLRTIGKWKD